MDEQVVARPHNGLPLRTEKEQTCEWNHLQVMILSERSQTEENMLCDIIYKQF